MALRSGTTVVCVCVCGGGGGGGGGGGEDAVARVKINTQVCDIPFWMIQNIQFWKFCCYVFPPYREKFFT